jgi:hypothetical protein
MFAHHAATEEVSAADLLPVDISEGIGCTRAMVKDGPSRLRQQPKDGPMQGRPLKDIPLPPDVADQVSSLRAAMHFTSHEENRWFDEEVKLQVYFGGLDVLCIETDNGRVVAAVAEPGSPVIRETIERLSDSEREHMQIVCPEIWHS